MAGIITWRYAVALLGMVVTAQALGLGGIPARDMQVECLVFAFLLLTLIAIVCKKFARHQGTGFNSGSTGD